MAIIIIQGTKEEDLKITSMLQNKFPVFNKKTVLKNEDGLTTVTEAFFDKINVDEFSDAETMKALECCSNAVRNCADCPYNKIENCKEKSYLDGVMVVNRMMHAGDKR